MLMLYQLIGIASGPKSKQTFLKLRAHFVTIDLTPTKKVFKNIDIWK